MESKREEAMNHVKNCKAKRLRATTQASAKLKD